MTARRSPVANSSVSSENDQRERLGEAAAMDAEAVVIKPTTGGMRQGQANAQAVKWKTNKEGGWIFPCHFSTAASTL